MTTRLLYHFPLSPFSRRARLALAHKGLDVQLKDARENPEHLVEARRRAPLKTIPVLVDGDRVLNDSGAIAHYLDHAYDAAPTLWPNEDAHLCLEVATLVDCALNNVIDLGTRYYALHDHAAWPAVKDEMLSRAQRALDVLGERATSLGRETVARHGWSAADIWLFTATAWLESLPARATTPNIAQIMSLGFTLPPALTRWADAHRERADVRALG